MCILLLVLWIINEIKTIEANKGRKAKVAQISTMKRQVRQKEIEYAFKKREWDTLHSSRQNRYQEENFLFLDEPK